MRKNDKKRTGSGVLSVLAHLKMKLNRVVLSRVFKNLLYKFSIKRINPNQSLVTAKDRFGLFSSGGDSRDRTGDLLNAIQALYQLSYTPKVLNRMVEAQGLEPWTSRM